jgi:hypothetical protein
MLKNTTIRKFYLVLSSGERMSDTFFVGSVRKGSPYHGTWFYIEHNPAYLHNITIVITALRNWSLITNGISTIKTDCTNLTSYSETLSAPTSGRSCTEVEIRWRRYVPPNRRVQLYGLHGVISQKMIIFRDELICMWDILEILWSSDTYTGASLLHSGACQM